VLQLDAVSPPKDQKGSKRLNAMGPIFRFRLTHTAPENSLNRAEVEWYGKQPPTEKSNFG
jgi:hypothetical protein